MIGVSPFEYNRIVADDQFIGREKEVFKLKNLVKSRKNALLYGPPKIGKRSVVFNALEELKAEGVPFKICKINLFNIRSLEDLLLSQTRALLSLFPSKTAMELKENLLKKINLSLEVQKGLTDREMKQLLAFPERCSELSKEHIIIYFEQFQDVLLFEKPLKVLSALEEQVGTARCTSYIIVGDKRNAMDFIFVQKNYFRNLVTHIQLPPINKKVFVQFIVDKFAENGKTASAKEASYIYDLLEGDPWYLQHILEICFLKTEHTLTYQIVEESLNNLIAIHDYELHNTVYTLSNHQLMLLKAILDGERRFSKADVLKTYRLNSSANVNRLREALTKKEIVTFVNKNKIEFNDILFKYWLEKFFFNN